VDVRAFTVGPFQENTFILRRGGADKALVIDPGDEAEKLLGALEQLGANVEAILITHTDIDHVGAVAPLARATGAPV
jgi:hydroxyacylglutathione hydrolase